jgi:AcrR family transcriptional regulator
MSDVKPARPRTKPAEERRDELLDSAQRLFLAQGVGATTIEQITSGADVAKGTFYLYFKSKEDLRSALGERFGLHHLAHVRAVAEQQPAGDWRGKLAAWAGASVAFYLDSIRLHDVLFYEGRSPTREGLVENAVIDYLVELLQGGLTDRAWTMDDPRSAAVFLFSGIHGVVDDAYSKEERVDRDRLVQRAERLCLGTVGPGPDETTIEGPSPRNTT